MLKQLLFPAKPDGTATSAMLLIARIVFGILLMNHGIQKWTNFQELSAVFPDPLGVGSPLSLGLNQWQKVCFITCSQSKHCYCKELQTFCSGTAKVLQ